MNFELYTHRQHTFVVTFMTIASICDYLMIFVSFLVGNILGIGVVFSYISCIMTNRVTYSYYRFEFNRKGLIRLAGELLPANSRALDSFQMGDALVTAN